MRHTFAALLLLTWLLLGAAGATAAPDHRATLALPRAGATSQQAWRRPPSGGAWLPVRAGERFGEGDGLRVAGGVPAELAFPGGVLVRLPAGGELQVHGQGLVGVGIEARSGRVYVRAGAGAVQVTTRDAIAAGREAEWLVEPGPRGTRVAVLSGAVKVHGELQETVHEIQELTAGQQALVPHAGPAGEPQAADPGQMAADAGLAPPELSAPVVVAAPPRREQREPSAAPPSAAPTPEPAAPAPAPSLESPAPAPVAATPEPAPEPPAAAPLPSPSAPPAAAMPEPSEAPSPVGVVIPPLVEPVAPSPEPTAEPVLTPSPVIVATPSPRPSASPPPRKPPPRKPPPRLAVMTTPIPLPVAPPSPMLGPGVMARMIVDKSEHRLYFYNPDGSLKKVYPIGLGAPGTPTPSGLRGVWSKVANPAGAAWALWPSSRGRAFGNRMLVLMWYDVKGRRFTWKSHQELHGTDVRVSIGRNYSHGCMRMLNEHIEEVFQGARVGDLILVRD